MILYAYELNRNRVFIENANPGQLYYCEECGTKLIPKNRGSIKEHHYAHYPDKEYSYLQEECTRRNEMRNANQMSEWHKYWQGRYPKDQIEKVFKKDSKVFRADVFLPKRKTVIEFQHSFLPKEQFSARNQFYTSLGYNVVWVYDFDELNGYYMYIYPDKFDDFIIRFRKENQKVYAMDKEKYYSLFGEWKPKDTPKVSLLFTRTYGEYKFYQRVCAVTGSFQNDYPITLFVDDLREDNFLMRIGL